MTPNDQINFTGNRRRLLLFVLVSSTLLVLLQARCFADTYFVDCAATQGSNDGSNWNDPFISLQDALAVAVSGDLIKVSAGVYYPDEGAAQTDGSAASSFVIPEGVALSGGWLVGASPHHGYSSDSRGRAPTILSGDLSQDDLDPDGNGVAESSTQIVGVNARHVVTIPPGTERSTVLWVTISGGNAEAVGRIEGNGGGVHSSGSFKLDRCRVVGNAADDAGGGVYVSSTWGSFSGCVVSGNSAGATGGGVHSENSDPSFRLTRFTANQALQGGALFNRASSPEVIGCLITGNWASDRGGAIVNESASDPSLAWCTLSGNASQNAGGAVYNDFSHPVFESVAVWNNRVGILTSTPAASVENLSSFPSFKNCLIANSGGSSAWDIVIGKDLGENLDQNPDFVNPVDPGLEPTAGGDYLPLPGSPLVDAGGVGNSNLDVDFHYRTTDGDGDGNPVSDIGAHEMPEYIYVDHSATGAGTGLSWGDAFVHLQDALALLALGVEIRVAEGIYYPDEGVGQTDGDPESTFQLGAEQGALVGGFPNGGGPQDIGVHRTVLSGDIDGNDRDLDGNGIAESASDIKGQNAAPVVTALLILSSFDPFRLEGVVVTGGSNSSGVGGGLLAVAQVSLNVDHCHFSGNYVGPVGGGAVYASQVRHLRFRHCRFTGNATAGSGGALYDRLGEVTVENCLFAGNSAGGSGGAAVTTDGGSTRATILDSCVFQGNVAGRSGGALCLKIDGNCYVSSCTFSGNRCGNTHGISTGRGGAVSVSASDFKAVDSVFWNNSSATGPDSVWITGQNPANVSAFGWCVVELAGGSAPWDSSSVVDLGGNLDLDPGFAYSVDPKFAPTVVGDYHPVAGSPLIDAGGAKHRAVGLDRDGGPRFESGRIDIGAYEGVFLPVYVDGTATGANSGSSWSDAYNYLADAIAAAVPGSVILVAAGVYYPDEGASANPDDVRFSFHLREEVSLVGGFSNGGGVRDPLTNVTVLSGDIGGDDIDPDSDGILARFSDLRGDNSSCVVAGTGVSASSSIDGFTITAGYTSSTNGVNGAGLNLNTASPSVFQCHFSGNQAHSKGGAIWCGNGACPVLIEVSCSGNSAFDGGALAAESGAVPILRRCTFTWNTARHGGAVHSDNSSPEFYACFISANDAVGNGGGSRHVGGSARYVNCAWLGNNAYRGGAVWGESATKLSIINGTIAGNRAGLEGGGLYLDNVSATVANSIIWHNLAAEGLGVSDLSHSIHTVGMAGVGNVFSDCLIAHAGRSGPGWDSSIGFDGGGNDTSDPRLALPPNPSSAPTSAGELHFLAGSPALDRGSNEMNAERLDLAGEDRIQNMIIDIGAFEGEVDPSDLDGDGLPDYWERAYHGSGSVVDPDSDVDNDLLSAFAEFALGLDPLVPNAPADYLQSAIESDGGIDYLTLLYRVNPAASGLVSYRVFRSVDLGAADSWSMDDTMPLSASPAGWGGSRSTMPMSGQHAEFLKLELEEAAMP